MKPFKFHARNKGMGILAVGAARIEDFTHYYIFHTLFPDGTGSKCGDSYHRTVKSLTQSSYVLLETPIAAPLCS